MSPENGTPVFELCGVHKSFGRNRVLRGLDLQVHAGRIFTIVGGSGSGKSVCLKHMIGLLSPDRGCVRVNGRDVSDLTESQWTPLRQQIGFVFQGAALFDSLSVFDNIAYPLHQHRRWPQARVAARVAECLDAVGLSGVEAQMPAELSGGMRKRIGVARAIALEPDAILYDEPTTGLDPANSRRIGELIRSLQERLSVTSVVVTHDLELCFRVSDRLVLLKGGCLVAEGNAEEIRCSPLADVREFLAGAAAAMVPAESGGGGGREA